MKKAINYFFIPLFITLVICAIIIKGGKAVEINEKKEEYTLRSYKNTVALYNGDKMLRIYDSIVLNSLPKADINNFKRGITFDSAEEVEIYLEDFDT